MTEATSNLLISPQVFDRDALTQRCMGNEALVEKLLSVFITSLHRERSSLQSAIDSGDLASTARLAHRLRGSASNVGAKLLATAARELESSARITSASEVQDRWDEVASQIDLLLSSLSPQTMEGSR